MKPPIAIRHLPVLSAVTLCFALVLSVTGAQAGDGEDRTARAPIVKTRKIAPGVRYMKIVRRQVPLRTFVLRLDLSKAITLDTTIADAALPSRRRLTDIVGSAGALAGVNGDYGDLGPGSPVHPFAQDGELLRTSNAFGTAFAVTRDESTVLFGNPRLDVTITDTSSGREFTLERWNQGDPAPGELVGFSPLGGTLEPPPRFACNARLLPQGPPTPAEPDGVDRQYVVDVVGCFAEPLARSGGVVISAAPATDEAVELLALQPGTTVRLHWTIGWSNVFDVVGGAPLLLRDGDLVGICNSACGRHPRTGVGVTASGEILLVVVDGRQPRWSRGATMFEFARILRDLGAVTAMNLDGGGSSEMVVKGDVVNRPSDGHERAITNAILVLPGPDPGEA
ncbi:MAG TPA: phosphodiester glycosidase family protein [Actinomycetota bacterium]|nr:phosphodiester glycosidase family protein [Actinomycetota bacterium]